MIRAKILTIYKAEGDVLAPDIPVGCGMSDTTMKANPVVDDIVVVEVTCNTIADLNGYDIIWSEVEDA